MCPRSHKTQLAELQLIPRSPDPGPGHVLLQRLIREWWPRSYIQPIPTLTPSLPGGINLTSKDPRWVGAWWLGFLISAGAVALAAIPYFFFPKEMPKEKQELRFRRKGLAVSDPPVSNVSPSLSHPNPSSNPHTLVLLYNLQLRSPGHSKSQLPKPSP